MSKQRIGWIGLGNMGIPMSQQLINAGYTVTVYNRSKEKEESLKASGAAIADTPKALIEQTDIVIVMVSDDQAVRDIYTGENGLLSADINGKLIINMSTISPGISRDMADQVAQLGGAHLDAPVSGSVKQAETAQLIIMVGGNPDDFDKAKPVLESMGKLVLHLGSHGAGNTAKLGINTLLAIQAQGLAEAVNFVQQQGIKTEDFLNIFNNGAIGNPFGKIKGDAILADNYKPAFALRHMVKDLGLAKTEGISSPLALTALQTYTDAAGQYADEDVIAVFKHLKAK